MITASDATRLISAIRENGRLRDSDHAVIARALVILIDRRADFPGDPVEELIHIIATLAVSERRRA
jgi:hypothetical protein